MELLDSMTYHSWSYVDSMTYHRAYRLSCVEAAWLDFRCAGSAYCSSEALTLGSLGILRDASYGASLLWIGAESFDTSSG